MQKKNRQKIIAIVGPTASGKSELAVFLAKQIGGEIISADSRQIYTHLNIGSNKVPGVWKNNNFTYKNIRHHCIDFVHPKKVFTVAHFKQCAKESIQEITARGKIPIIVGGTGFYIDAVLYNTAIPHVPPDNKLRKTLEKKTTGELFEILKKLDLRRAKNIDLHNPRRLIRAIEIIKHTKEKIPKFSQRPAHNTLILGIRQNEEVLKKTLRKRSKKQVKRGLLQETKQLINLTISKKRIREFGFEYCLALDCIKNNWMLDIQSLEEELMQKNWRYAKRQMTWFKKNKNIIWITSDNQALRHTQIFLKNNNIDY